MKALCEKMTKELEVSKDKMCALRQELKVLFYDLNIKCESSAKKSLFGLKVPFCVNQTKPLYCVLLSRILYLANLCEVMLLYLGTWTGWIEGHCPMP